MKKIIFCYKFREFCHSILAVIFKIVAVRPLGFAGFGTKDFSFG
jgi:hypothetical protein